VSLLRVFRHGPLLAWASIFAVTAVAVAVWSFGAPAATATAAPGRVELLNDVFSTRALLGTLLSPGEPGDALTVAAVAGDMADKWAGYDTPTAAAAAATFDQLSEHAEMSAAADEPEQWRAAVTAALADGDDLVAIAYGVDDVNHDRAGDTPHPALTGDDPPAAPADARERVSGRTPTTSELELGDLPR
jgi:hypothetical protein